MDDIDWKEETEIDGERYDWPKLKDNYTDENDYPEPHRHITNWYIVKKNKGQVLHDGKRYLFKDKNNMIFIQGLVLCGQLKPYKEKVGDSQKVHVTIDKLKGATFDKHAIDRGFWIESKRAWYRLEDPDKTRIQDDNGRSQYDIFLQYRALGGLLSNIIDMNSNEIGGVSHIVQTYRDFEPEELHRKLSLTPDERQSLNTDSPIDPYDMNLIRLRSDFLVTELKTFDKEFGENCTFYKGLKRLSAEIKKARRRKDDSQYDYLKSARLSEIRSERNAYGGQILGSDGKWVNPYYKLSNFKKDKIMLTEERVSTKHKRGIIELSGDEDSSVSSDSQECYTFVSTKKKTGKKKKIIASKSTPSQHFKRKSPQQSSSSSSFCPSDYDGCFNNDLMEEESDIDSIEREHFIRDKIQHADNDIAPEPKLNTPPSSPKYLVITPSPLQTTEQPYMPSSPSTSPLDECFSLSASSFLSLDSDKKENVEQHEIIKKIDALDQQIDALNQQKIKLLRQLQESNNSNGNNDNGDNDGDDKDSPAEENESLLQDKDYYCSSPGTQADDEEGSIAPLECNKNM